MSNTNNNLQTQTSNALHNAIMEAGGKDRPPMLAPDIRNQLDAEAEAVQIILTWIDNDIYSIVDACPNACELWKAIGRDGETLESYYVRFYKMINKLVRNQCDVTNHQVNVQFLLQLQPEWQMFMTLVKQRQELKTVSYHKLYDILKQHLNEVNEIRVERLARTANPLARVAQQQPVYHPQNYPTHYTQNSSTISQQVATRKRGKAIVNSPPHTYDLEHDIVAEDDALSKEKEIDKLMALISLSFKKIYKPTNNNLKTSSNTSTQVVHQSGIQCYNCKGFRHVARECQKPKWAKDAAYHKEKMLLCKQEEADNAAENYGPIFDVEPLQKSDNNITTDLLDMSNNRKKADQDDDDNLAKKRDLLASLIEKLKCKIDDSKNRNKILESSNKTLVDKLKGEITDFKNKNKSFESSNNHFKEANTKPSKNNQLMFKDLKKYQVKLDRQIVTRHRFSPNKSSPVYEKTSPRSDLRWKPTGRIFKSVGLRWIPTGKSFDSCTGKVHQSMFKRNKVLIEVQSWKDYTVFCSTNNSDRENQVVSKSSAVTTADASDKRQQQPDSTLSTSTLGTTARIRRIFLDGYAGTNTPLVFLDGYGVFGSSE
ncbi:hypothetical protein Tco_0180249 [Tanacetum coccineum]